MGKNGFKPININNKIIIYDARNSSDSAIEIVGNDVIKIGIEAKQAFGTGTHETTRLVISELLNIALRNKRVLDCGCGTGILSITASKLGAEEIVGYDIDNSIFFIERFVTKFACCIKSIVLELLVLVVHYML